MNRLEFIEKKKARGVLDFYHPLVRPNDSEYPEGML